MSGFQAVQAIVLVFGIIFLALLIVMVIGRKRFLRKKSLQQNSLKVLKTSPKSVDQMGQSLQAEGIELDPILKNELIQKQILKEKNELNELKELKDQKDISLTAKSHLTLVPTPKTMEQVESQESPQGDIAIPQIDRKIDRQEQPEPIHEELHKKSEITPLSKALEGTRQRMWGRLQALWTTGSKLADLDEIEEVLYTSDLGPQTVSRLLDSVKQNLSRSEKKDSEVVRSALRNEILQIFKKTQGEVEPTELFEKFQFQKTSVWLVVGVNGAGKTTSIGKIASQLAQSGKKVLLAAGDTFRAAAGSQLKVWTERAQVEIFSPEGVTDPSAVAFDAVQRGVAKNYDVVIVDTAGRLHTQHNLMEEIKKMKRVIQKVIPEAPHEILLVLDSNQGQNALMQAKEFHKALGVTGVVLTKLDGSAKGGVAVGVAHELELPIKLIGVGEKMEDLRSFSPKNFIDSILS